LPGLLA